MTTTTETSFMQFHRWRTRTEHEPGILVSFPSLVYTRLAVSIVGAAATRCNANASHVDNSSDARDALSARALACPHPFLSPLQALLMLELHHTIENTPQTYP